MIAVVSALDTRLVVQIRWRAGDLDRLLDADHADLVAAMSKRLRADGWEPRVEVTYASGGVSGSIDILAWHAATQSLLVIEIKTEITSAEATLRKLDEKGRIAAAAARERFGWRPLTVSRLLVVEDTSTARRRIDAHAELFDGALPTGGAAIRRWLKAPSGSVAGRLFLSPSTPGTLMKPGGGRHRIRQRPSAVTASKLSTDSPPTAPDPADEWPAITLLRG